MAKRRNISPPTEKLIEIYRTMLTIRVFEEQARKVHMAGLAPGLVHLYSGQEAVAAGACAALGPGDYIASHHRGHGHCIAKGGALDRLFAEIMGRRAGYGLGRGGSMHIYDPTTGNLGTNGIVGGSVPLATGAALASHLRANGGVAVSFFGDGVLNQGIMFEVMNMAAIWSLPVIYICENNRYGEFTETSTVTAGKSYLDRGRVFDIPSSNVDGMDVRAVYGAVTAAVKRARAGSGPSFLVCETYRYSGHHVSDSQDYKADDEMLVWKKRDPIVKFATWLMRSKHCTKTELSAINLSVETEVQEALDSAKTMPAPAPTDLMKYVYAAGS
jgi:pyruvate dehydrogenase E1 component alpha subunit